MSQTFENYCRKLRREADALALEAEARSRFEHLHAFNFGRSLERIEHARDAFWLRVRWLLLGAAVGVTLAAVYLQVFQSARILQIVK
jgi:hypothetical protein